MGSAAQLIAEKLLHPSGDVRARTLQNLEFKLRHGILTEQDVAEEPRLTQSLLRLISLGDGASVTTIALMLCQQLASRSEQLATQLLQQGALLQAQQLLQEGPADLRPAVSQLLETLQPSGAGRTAAAGAGDVGPGAGPSRPDRLQQEQQPASTSSAHAPAQPPPPPAAAGTPPAAEAGYRSHVAAGEQFMDERLLRAQARADWRQQQDLPGPKHAVGAWLRLPRVPLTAADDQYLFELNVRLQYSDDEALLLPALEELGSIAAADFPAEALLQRQSLLDNVLALLASPRMSPQVHQAASTAVQQLLHGLRRSLALAADPALSDNAVAAAARTAAAMAAVANAGGAAAAGPDKAAVAAAAGAPAGSGFGSWPAAAAVAGAVTPVTCPSSYPQLQLPAMSPQEAAWQLLPDPVDGCVDVGAVVWRILLQVADLLHATERHWHLLPIVDLALPLALLPLQLAAMAQGPAAAAPSSAAAAGQEAGGGLTQQQQQQQQARQQAQSEVQAQQVEQVVQQVASQWRALLASLSRALVAALAMARSTRAAAVVSAAGGGQLSEAAQAAVAPGTSVLLAGLPADHGWDGLGNGEEVGTAAWDLPCIHLVQLAVHCMEAAPAGWLGPDSVPRVVADAVLAAALDGAVAQQVPGLRPAAVGLLQGLRPHGLLLLEWAEGVRAALQLATQCIAGLPALTAQLQAEASSSNRGGGFLAMDCLAAAGEWLQLLVGSLAGLGYSRPADAQLLRAAVQGIAACTQAACAAGEAGANVMQLCVQITLAVLTHSSSFVQHSTYGLLAAALDAGASNAMPASYVGQPAVEQRVSAAARLVEQPAVLECLVVLGLGQQGTRAAAAEVLQSWLQWALQQPGPLTASLLLQWSGWLACYTNDAAAGPLAQAWVVAVQQQVEQAVPGGWQEAALHIRQLFSSSAGARQAAARQLLQILGLPPSQLASPVGSPKGAAGAKPPSDLQDPFRGLLDPRSHTLDPLTDCEASLAANFTPGDVRKLLRVLLHEGLASELRRSAAEELLPLLVLPELRAELEQEEVLEQLWALVQPRWQDENTAPGGNTAARDAFEAAASLFDMQLPVAVLQLLTGLLARSSVVGPWLQQQGDSLLLPTLGLAFHPLTSVRRATARLLSLAVLGWDAQQSSSYQATTGGPLLPLGATGMVLPEPFLQHYKWPFKTEAPEGLGTWVQSWVGQLQQCSVAPPGVQLLEQQQAQLEEQQQRQREAEDGWGLGVTGDLGGWSPGGHAAGGSTQVLRAALHNMLAQQRVLHQQQSSSGADHAAGAASPGHADISDVPQTLLAATTANAAALDYPGAAAAALGRVAGAHNHRECGAGLQALLDLTTSAQGIQAVAAAAWQGPLKRLLAAAPVTEEDQQLWLQVLQLVQRLLLACALPEADNVLLQQCLARSAIAWLQQPGTAAELLRVPLALARMPGAAPAATLAAAAELAAETGAATGWAWQLLRLRVSRAVLSLLLVVVRCSEQLCDSRSPAASLAALQPGQLLPLLTQALLKQVEGTDYYCRLLAVRVLQHVVCALQAAAAAALPGLPPANQEHEEVLLSSFEPVITGVVMPAAAKQAQGFRGKGLVRGGLDALLALTDGPLLGPGVWCLAWGAVGGTFWLSRLSRDKEAAIRCAAVQLLERCLAPGATSTTTMLLQGWPDALSRLVRVAADPSEAWGVRAAALRFLVAAAAVPQEVCQQAAAAAEAAGAAASGSHEAGPSAAAADGGEADGRSSKGLRLPRFGLAGVLQQQQLWEVLPALLAVAAGSGTVSSILDQQSVEQPPAEVAAAAASCCLVALMGDPDGVGHQLLSHGQVVVSLQQLVAAGRNAGAAAEELQQQLLQGRSRPCAWLGRRSDQLPAIAAAVKQWQEDGSLRTYLRQLLLLQLGSDACSSCGLEPIGLMGLTSGNSSSIGGSSGAAPLSAALLRQLVDQHTSATLLAASQALQVLCVPAATPAAGGDLSLPSALVQQLGQLPGLVGQALCNWAYQLHQLGHLCDGKKSGDPRSTPLIAPEAAAAGQGQPGSPPPQLVLVTGARVGQWEVLLAGLLQAASGLAALLEPLEGQQLQETLERVHNAASSCAITDETGGGQSQQQEPQPMGLLVAVAVGLQQLHLQAAAAAAAASAAAADAGQQLEGEEAQAMQQQQELPPSVAGGCLVLCGLLSCLLVEEASARLLLADGEYGEEPRLPGSSTPVGAALCRLLLSMLPSSALNVAVSGDASQWQSVGDLLQQPLPATALLALRSLLCFSDAAKAAAVQAQLHQQLLASCQLLGQVVAADGAIPDPEQRVLMDISNSSAGAAAAAAAAGGRTALGTGGSAVGAAGPRPFQRPGSRRARAEVLTLDGPLQAAGSPSSVKGLSAAGEVKQAGPQQQKPQQQPHGPRLRWASRMAQAAGGSSSGSPARSRPGGAATRSSRDAASSSGGMEPPVASSVPPPAATAAAPAAGGSRAGTPATSVASAGAGKRAAQAAALKEAESRLLLCLLMLRHLVYKGGPVKEALVSAGLVDVLVGVWPAAVPRPALLQELLALVSSMVHGCPAFRAAMSQRKGKAGRGSRPKTGSATGSAAADGADGPGLLGLMVAVVLDPSAELGLFSAVTRVLLGYSASPEGGAVLGRQERFSAAASKLLSGFLARKEWSRACHMTQVLASVSAHAEGQAVLLDATTAPAILDLAVQVLLSPHAGASTAALLLLRNLCLHSAARGPVLGHPQLLGLLLCASECLLPAPSAAAGPEGAAARGGVGSGAQAGAAPTAAAAGSGRPPKPLPVWVKYGKPQTADTTATTSRLGRGGAVAAAGSGGGRPGQPLTTQGLLGSIEGNVCAAVYAVSALWALVYQGESLKAGLRKLPSAVERLAQVQAHASWLASGLSAGPSSDEAQLAAAAAAERCQFSPASINTRQPGEWLQELQDGCEALRELMADG